jgi:hypothetical protein
VAGLGLLLVEAVLSNIQSRKLGLKTGA